MAGICFYFEDNDIDVWSGRSIDLDAWNYSIKLCSDIDKVIIINKTSQSLSSFDSDLDILITDTEPELEGHTTQLVCPWEITPQPKIPLWDFNHQTDWYLFGPALGWGGNYNSDLYITIPQDGMSSCHAVHVSTTLLSHRYKTLWL